MLSAQNYLISDFGFEDGLSVSGYGISLDLGNIMMGDKIVDFIDLYIEEHGYSPNFQEIGESVGISSMGHVSYWIDKLVIEGRLTKEPNISRSVRVVR